MNPSYGKNIVESPAYKKIAAVMVDTKNDEVSIQYYVKFLFAEEIALGLMEFRAIGMNIQRANIS